VNGAQLRAAHAATAHAHARADEARAVGAYRLAALWDVRAERATLAALRVMLGGVQ
jgi:hypothetical protein